ncbi:spore protease YyaC [Cohnella sp. CIP 111063]|jgi:putative sporulation protein YyaC|uniref:spore protease YyaC n=1 Tax=unclassified Cohnella TaxID=2636738 RepID=UPI000B8BD74B|nr:MULTISPECIES: spore protease YyaC [unclassified Cohnella]OXS55562.1 spore protease YyaC [Cohnella sp. CIP 111063]PRX66405.1 putative sporulation protein YyaC [Cohnella sp. SGD-V74]
MSILPMPYYVAHTDPAASMRLASKFGAYFNRLSPHRRIVVVCIGTDRCTGDSLGPLTGTLLGKYRSPEFEIFGTLENPVHAMNLADTMDKLSFRFDDPFVIGIDACLGQASSIGAVVIGDGPLRPGAGVNKQLPPVGDIHVSGIVNIGGLLGYQALQSTRLHLVMNMAGLISRSLLVGIRMSTDRATEPAVL